MDDNFRFGFFERLAVVGIVIGVAGAVASWVVPPSFVEWLIDQGIQPDYLFAGSVLLIPSASVPGENVSFFSLPSCCTTIAAPSFLVDSSAYGLVIA